MEAKDRKFYSNPSHNPNFGHYSPPVPTSLLEKLAAMKLNKTSGKEDPPTSQTTGDRTNQNSDYNAHQDGILKLQRTQRMDTTEFLPATNHINIIQQITPAKRQKMDSENSNNQHEDSRVGSAQQASPRQ
jgi:hypothetical protein